MDVTAKRLSVLLERALRGDGVVTVNEQIEGRLIPLTSNISQIAPKIAVDLG